MFGAEGRTSKRRPVRGCAILAIGTTIGVTAILAVFAPGVLFVVVLGVPLLLNGLLQGWQTLPAVHGTVTDMQTGKPVPGVVMKRSVTGWGIPGNLEHEPEGSVSRASISVTTDADGRFVFPSVWWVHGLKRTEWTAYKNGLMPGSGFIFRDDRTRRLDCPLQVDAWYIYQCVFKPGRIELNVRMSRPTLEGVKFKALVFDYTTNTTVARAVGPSQRDEDPFGEYLARLRVRASEQQFPKEEVVRQALEHVEKGGEIGERGVSEIGEIAGWIAGDDPARPLKTALLLNAANEYCAKHPASETCRTRRGGFHEQLANREVPGTYQSDAYELPPLATLAFGGSKGIIVIAGRMGRDYRQGAGSLCRGEADIDDSARILIIPSGALSAAERYAAIRERLESFVEAGGALIVMAPSTAEEFEAIPVPSGERLKAFGYRQDQSAVKDSVWVAGRHAITSCFADKTASVAVDGFLEEWPRQGEVLLRRVDTGAVVMVVYSIGRGSVVVSTVFEDTELADGRSSEDGTGLLANLISWAAEPARKRARCTSDGRCDMSARVTLHNETGIPVDRVAWRIVDPLRPKEVVSRWEDAITIPAGKAAAVEVRPQFPRNSRLRPGIYQVSCRLLDSTFAQRRRQGSPEPLAVQAVPDAGQVVVEPQSEGTRRGSELALGFAAGAEPVARFEGLPLHVSLRNFGEKSFWGAVELAWATRQAQDWTTLATRPMVVASNGLTTLDEKLSGLPTASAHASGLWLRARLPREDAHDLVITSQKWVRRDPAPPTPGPTRKR